MLPPMSVESHDGGMKHKCNLCMKDDDIRGRATSLESIALECRVTSLQISLFGTTTSLPPFSIHVRMLLPEMVEEFIKWSNFYAE